MDFIVGGLEFHVTAEAISTSPYVCSDSRHDVLAEEKQTYGMTSESAPPRKHIRCGTAEAKLHRHHAELTKNQSHRHEHRGN